VLVAEASAYDNPVPLITTGPEPRSAETWTTEQIGTRESQFDRIMQRVLGSDAGSDSAVARPDEPVKGRSTSPNEQRTRSTEGKTEAHEEARNPGKPPAKAKLHAEKDPAADDMRLRKPPALGQLLSKRSAAAGEDAEVGTAAIAAKPRVGKPALVLLEGSKQPLGGDVPESVRTGKARSKGPRDGEDDEDLLAPSDGVGTKHVASIEGDAHRAGVAASGEVDGPHAETHATAHLKGGTEAGSRAINPDRPVSGDDRQTARPSPEKTASDSRQPSQSVTVVDLRDSGERNSGNAERARTDKTTVPQRSDDASAVGRSEAERSTEGNTDRHGSESGKAGPDDGQDGIEIRYIRTDSAKTAPSSTATETRHSFGQLVREHLNPEIVRQSGLVLRNAKSGEIRLVLKPEHLGSLRVRLELDDNRITGRIIVDNSLVKETVEQNMDALMKSFRDHGFNAAALDVTVSGDRRREHAEQPFPSTGAASSRQTVRGIEESTPLVHADYQSTINLVV
jgi:hypothetical protein